MIIWSNDSSQIQKDRISEKYKYQKYIKYVTDNRMWLMRIQEKHRRFIVFIPFLSLLLWVISLALSIDGPIGEYGLVSSLHWTFYIAFGSLMSSLLFFIYYQRGDSQYDRLIISCQLIILFIFIFVTPLILEKTIRGPHSWQKYGFTDYIIRNDHLSSSLIYHNWPIFFIFSAMIQDVTGLGPDHIMGGIPLLLNGLILLFSCIFFHKLFPDDRKRAWIGVIILYMIMWVNQFMYLPQVMGLTLFILLLYLIFMHFNNMDIRILASISVLLFALFFTHLLTAIVLTIFLSFFILNKIMDKSGRATMLNTIMENKRTISLIFVLVFIAALVWYVFSVNLISSQNWSLDDFEKIALEIHEKSGIWGMGDGIDNEQRWKSTCKRRTVEDFGSNT